MRSKVILALVGVLVLWTVFMAGEGIYIVRALERSTSGDDFVTRLPIVATALGMDRVTLNQMWADPSYRASFVTSFELSMWQARITNWAVVAGIIILLAVLAAVALKREGDLTATGDLRN